MGGGGAGKCKMQRNPILCPLETAGTETCGFAVHSFCYPWSAVVQRCVILVMYGQKVERSLI